MNPKSGRPVEDEEPFKRLKINNWMILENVNERSPCSVCKKSRKYFCYTCYVPVIELADQVPKMKLPIKIDIIKHAREIDGKSTAAHAAVLAPDDVKIFTYPCIPEYGDDEKVVLVYPSKDATSVQDLFSLLPDLTSTEDEPRAKRLNLGSKLPITRAVFIDSTWNQSRGIYKDSRLRGLPCVVLETRISQFWRHQTGSPRWYLATIEAVHQFLVELHQAAFLGRGTPAPNPHGPPVKGTEVQQDSNTPSRANLKADCKGNCGTSASKDLQGGESCTMEKSSREGTGAKREEDETNPYDGEYDNLLFFFRYMYSKIHQLYNHDDLKAYKRPLK